MKSALRSAKKRVQYIEFEGATHSIHEQDYLIEMFQEMGNFLEWHLEKRKS